MEATEEEENYLLGRHLYATSINFRWPGHGSPPNVFGDDRNLQRCFFWHASTTIWSSEYWNEMKRENFFKDMITWDKILVGSKNPIYSFLIQKTPFLTIWSHAWLFVVPTFRFLTFKCPNLPSDNNNNNNRESVMSWRERQNSRNNHLRLVSLSHHPWNEIRKSLCVVFLTIEWV